MIAARFQNLRANCNRRALFVLGGNRRPFKRHGGFSNVPAALFGG